MIDQTLPSNKPAQPVDQSRPEQPHETMPHGTGLPLTIMAFMVVSFMLAMVGSVIDQAAQSDVAMTAATLAVLP